VLEKQTVNSKFYKEVIKRLITWVSRKWVLVFSARQCTSTFFRCCLLSFWWSERSPCYPIHPTPLN
jgi:hypothetical protein